MGNGFFDQARDGCRGGGAQAEALAQGAVGEVVALHVFHAGMEIAGPEFVFGGKVGKSLFGVEGDTGAVAVGVDFGGWQLGKLAVDDHSVPAGAEFFTHAQAAHEGSEFFVARLWRVVDDAESVDQRRACVGDFDAPGEQLHNRTSACDGKILVNQGVGNGLTDNRHWIGCVFFANGAVDGFCGRQQGFDEGEGVGKSADVAFVDGGFAQNVEAAVVLVLHNAQRLARHAVESAQLAGEQKRAKIGDGVEAVVLLFEQVFLAKIMADAFLRGGQRQFAQFKIARIIEQLQRLAKGQVLGGVVVLVAESAQFVPELGLNGGIVAELFGVAANAHIVHFFKAHRVNNGLVNDQHANGFFLYGQAVKLKLGIVGQEGAQPVFQLLAAFLEALQVVAGADNVMGGVVDAPYHVGAVFVVQGGTVGKRADVLADHGGGVVVVLEFQPLGFVGQLAQFVDQLYKMVHGVTSNAFIHYT